MPEEEEAVLPGVLLGQRDNIEKLFQLCAAPSEHVRSAVYTLLQHIPRSPDAEAALEQIATATRPAQGGGEGEGGAEDGATLAQAADALQQLQPTLGASASLPPDCPSIPVRALYYLEAVAGKAWGIRQQQTSFRSNFVAIGGVQLLAQLLSGGLALSLIHI